MGGKALLHSQWVKSQYSYPDLDGNQLASDYANGCAGQSWWWVLPWRGQSNTFLLNYSVAILTTVGLLKSVPDLWLAQIQGSWNGQEGSIGHQYRLPDGPIPHCVVYQYHCIIHQFPNVPVSQCSPSGCRVRKCHDAMTADVMTWLALLCSVALENPEIGAKPVNAAPPTNPARWCTSAA